VRVAARAWRRERGSAADARMVNGTHRPEDLHALGAGAADEDVPGHDPARGAEHLSWGVGHASLLASSDAWHSKPLGTQGFYASTNIFSAQF
jgi:hypothetical protein